VFQTGQDYVNASAHPHPHPPDADRNPIFDLIALGIGPDGHVASLFPNRPELAVADGRWILPVADSPKPPPERITFSLPVINAAKEVLVIALGEGKAEIVHRALEVSFWVAVGGCQLAVGLRVWVVRFV
jgi:6-phosphogluconolactonase/glucosamine-6-phosphate isomerase/deaminase